MVSIARNSATTARRDGANTRRRGVGMDVVRTNIEQIGGVVDVASTAGRGSHFSIKIPLTLAIVSALIVGCDEERFAIPQLAVRELVRVGAGSEHTFSAPGAIFGDFGVPDGRQIS